MVLRFCWVQSVRTFCSNDQNWRRFACTDHSCEPFSWLSPHRPTATSLQPCQPQIALGSPRSLARQHSRIPATRAHQIFPSSRSIYTPLTPLPLVYRRELVSDNPTLRRPTPPPVSRSISILQLAFDSVPSFLYTKLARCHQRVGSLLPRPIPDLLSPRTKPEPPHSVVTRARTPPAADSPRGTRHQSFEDTGTQESKQINKP